MSRMVTGTIVGATLVSVGFGCGTPDRDFIKASNEGTAGTTGMDAGPGHALGGETSSNDDQPPDIGTVHNVGTSVGQISGAGQLKSANYSLTLTVGGPPMGTKKTSNHSISTGVGAIINQ